MKTPFRQFLTALAVMLGASIVLGIGSLWYLHTDHARVQLLNALNLRIPGSIAIQRLSLSLISGRVDIWHLKIMDVFQDVAAECDHLSVSISWQQLLHGKLHVESARIDKPRVKVSVFSDGNVNFSHIFFDPSLDSQSSDAQSDLFFPLVLDSVSFSDATLSYADSQENLFICLENMDATFTADFLKGAGITNIQIGSGQISGPFLNTLLGPVSIQGSLKDGEILPLHLSLLSPGLNAEISGSISNIWKDPQFSLRVNVDSMLSALQQSLDLETTLSGRAQLSGTVFGPLFNPNADLLLTCTQATIDRYPLNDFEMRASLNDRIITLDASSETNEKGAFRLAGNADLKQAFASGLFTSPDDLTTLSGNMQISLDSLSLDSIHPSASGLVSGTLGMQCKGYPGHSAKADFGIDLTASKVSAHPDIAPVDMRINSQSQWDSSGFRIYKLLAQAGTTRLKAAGNWNAPDNQVSGDLSCQSDDLSRSLSPLGIRGAAGSLDVQARLSGTLDRPEWSLKLKSRGLGYGEIQIGTLEVDAALDPSGILRVLALSLKNRGSELTAKGEVPVFSGKGTGSRTPYAFTATFRRIQPADFLRSSVIQGMIDGDCVLKGTENSLTGHMKIQTNEVTVQDVRIGNVTGEFELSEGRIEIRQLFLQNRRSHVDFSGNVQVFEPGSLSLHHTMPFRLSGSANGLHAQDFTDVLKGKISMAAELKGTPDQIVGSASLQGEQLETDPKVFRQKLAAVELEADFKDNRLSVSRAHATVAPGESLNASGWIGMDGFFDCKLSADGISLHHIGALADNWPAGEGKLFINLTGSGHLDHPRIQADMVLNPFRFYECSWDNSRIALQLADDLARVRIQSPVQGMLSYQFQTRDYAVELNCLRMELSPFLQSAGLTGAGGTLSGRLSATGNVDSLKTLKADAVFSEFSLNATGKSVVEGRDLHLGIQNEALVIPRNRLSLFQEGTLDIGGEARPGQSVSLRLNADIPINSARHLNDALSDLRGNLLISASMKGPWHSPDTEAFVEIRNAGLIFDESSQDLHDVNGRIHITPKALTVEGIEGQLDSGRITLKGTAGLDDYRIQDVNVKLTASELPITVKDTLDVKLNADLTLKGTAHAPAIQGEIVILEGLYYKNVILNPLKSLFRRERSLQVRQEVVFPAMIQNTLLDIRIPPRNLFVVDNNLAQLNLSPDMRIAGTLQRPIIQGRTRVDSGSLQYQSTTFHVKKGSVDFINPYTMESVIDIQSQASIQNWTVFLDISGPLDKLDLKLSSSPFLDDNDLLSLLITGKTARSAINKSSSSSTSSQKMLADLLSASIGNDLKKMSGLDILEVDSTGESHYFNDDLSPGRTPMNAIGESRYANDNPLKVTFGKIISPQITLKYSVENKGGVTFQRAITEYMFVENILLSGFQDSRGVFGGEFKFRYEFR